MKFCDGWHIGVTSGTYAFSKLVNDSTKGVFFSIILTIQQLFLGVRLEKATRNSSIALTYGVHPGLLGTTRNLTKVSLP